MRFKIIFLTVYIFAFMYIDLHALLVWLNDGSVVQGEIVEYDEKRIVLKRLDNGGTIDILWNEIHPICQKELKKRTGIVTQEKASYNVAGVKVYLKTGGIALGKVLKQTPEHVLLKTKTTDLTIPSTNILVMEKVSVPINQIYKPEEIYEEFKKQYSLETADGNLKFGEFLLKVNHYIKAKIHLEKAKNLDSSMSSTIQPLLDTISKETEVLQQKKEIQLYHSYKNNHNYGKAMDILKKLQTILSQNDWERYEKELKESQEEYLKKQIGASWIQIASQKIAAIASNRKLSLKQAQEKLANELQKEILASLAEQFQITSEEVQNYFDKREETTLYRYSYRTGTFIVGTTGRLPDGKEPPVEKVSTIRLKSSNLLSPDQWWQTVNYSSRHEWLMACYCENQFQIVDQELKPCSHCAGKGYETSGGKEVVCSLCHGLRSERTVVVR